MYDVIGIGKASGEEVVILHGVTEREAERECEQWGWSYDDGHKAYWMSIREGENE